MIHNISICAGVQGHKAISTTLNYGKSSGLTLFRYVFLKTHNPTSLRIIWIILHMIMICSLNQIVHRAEWIGLDWIYCRVWCFHRKFVKMGIVLRGKHLWVNLPTLLAPLPRKDWQEKLRMDFFLTVKETLVVGLAQRAIICIFFDWFPNVSFCI